jgi:hypothetical protein
MTYQQKLKCYNQARKSSINSYHEQIRIKEQAERDNRADSQVEEVHWLFVSRNEK